MIFFFDLQPNLKAMTRKQENELMEDIERIKRVVDLHSEGLTRMSQCIEQMGNVVDRMLTLVENLYAAKKR